MLTCAAGVLLMSFYVFRLRMCVIFFFKQKTAYEMRISDWSSDVCSSVLLVRFEVELLHRQTEMIAERLAQMLAPGRRGGELHDAGQIVTTLHACSLCC